MLEFLLVAGLMYVLYLLLQFFLSFWYVFAIIFIIICIVVMLRKKKLKIAAVLRKKKLEKEKLYESYAEDHQKAFDSIKKNEERKMQLQKDISRLRGIEFEKYCIELLKESGFYNVFGTKGSGDQGVDIIAHKGGMKYAIQCKGYEKDVGNAAIKDAIAGKAYIHADIAVAMINTRFTSAAFDLAREADVKLWDKNVLVNMAQNIKSNKPDYARDLKEYLSNNKTEQLQPITYISLKGDSFAIDMFTTTSLFESHKLDRLFCGRSLEILVKTGKNVFYCLKSLSSNDFNAYYTLLAIDDEEVHNVQKQFQEDYFIGIVYHG